MKTRPNYPARGFENIEAAHAWAAKFVAWYNNEHRHSSIGYVTPNQRHRGQAEDILRARRCVYEQARKRHPERWSGKARGWTASQTVYLNPDRNTLDLLRNT